MKADSCEKNELQSLLTAPEFSIYDFKRFWTNNRKDSVCNYMQKRLIGENWKDLDGGYLDVINDVLISFTVGPDAAIFLLPNTATWDDLFKSIRETVLLRMKYLRLGMRYRDFSACLFYDGKVHFDNIRRDLSELPSIKPYAWWADSKRLVTYDPDRDDNRNYQSQTQLDNLIARETRKKMIAEVIDSRDFLDWQLLALYLLPEPGDRPTQERLGEIAAQALKKPKMYSAAYMNQRLQNLRKWLKTVV